MLASFALIGLLSCSEEGGPAQPVNVPDYWPASSGSSRTYKVHVIDSTTNSSLPSHSKTEVRTLTWLGTRDGKPASAHVSSAGDTTYYSLHNGVLYQYKPRLCPWLYGPLVWRKIVDFTNRSWSQDTNGTEFDAFPSRLSNSGKILMTIYTGPMRAEGSYVGTDTFVVERNDGPEDDTLVIAHKYRLVESIGLTARSEPVNPEEVWEPTRREMITTMWFVEGVGRVRQEFVVPVATIRSRVRGEVTNAFNTLPGNVVQTMNGWRKR